jgi:hypothetical protein
LPRILSPEQRHWNISIQASLRSREPLVPLVVTLVLCLVAFFLLTAGEAWAEEQPNQTQMVQQGTVESKTMIDGKEILDPLPTAPSASETAPVEAYPVRTEKPPPSPATPAQMTSVTDYLASQRPAPQQFAVTIVNGEVVGSDPVVQEPPPTPTAASGDDRPAPQAAVPDQYRPQTTSDPDPVASSSDGGNGPAPAPRPVSSTDNPLPSVSSDPTPQASDPVSWPTLEPEPVASGENVPLPVAAGEPLAPSVAGTDLNYSAARKPPTAGPTVPVGVSGTSPLPASFGTATSTMSNGVVNSAAKIAHDAAETLAAGLSGTLASGSVKPSADGTRHDPPSQEEEAPQPVTPRPPPAGGTSSFSLSGGGHGGSTGVVPLLLVGVLASGLVLLRRSGWRYLASCEVPKPSSALLSPLERPG